MDACGGRVCGGESFAQQLGFPFPLLAAIGARTERIEIGTGVIDMRYENPLYMAENAAAAELIAGDRLQLGVSRGSPEQVIDGFRYFGHVPEEDDPTGASMARNSFETFLRVIDGARFAEPNPRPIFPNPHPGPLAIEPQSPGLRDRIWWGAASDATARWAAEVGLNLQSSTLKLHESDEPFHVQQRKQIDMFRDAWAQAGHEREPRVSVSRSRPTSRPASAGGDRRSMGSAHRPLHGKSWRYMKARVGKPIAP